MIELHNVAKTYGESSNGFTALQDINLSFTKGEHVAIIGKSGSGKSTLLNMLSGIDHPTTGTVVINGANVHALSESQLASWRGRNIGIVFQFFQLIPTLTVLENIVLAMDFVNVIPHVDRHHRAMALLEQVGIDPQYHKFPAALSGGEQQRAAIARALANDPPCLIADEPTGNLDSHTAAVIHSLFKELVAAGKTVIVVTHDNTASACFQRVITLKDGRVESDHQHTALREGALA